MNAAADAYVFKMPLKSDVLLHFAPALSSVTAQLQSVQDVLAKLVGLAMPVQHLGTMDLELLNMVEWQDR